jgi:hypothetical protein
MAGGNCLRTGSLITVNHSPHRTRHLPAEENAFQEFNAIGKMGDGIHQGPEYVSADLPGRLR